MTAGKVQIQALDILFAFKAIALSEHLIGNQKRVAAALIDHFNRKTGQCDPSLDTIAALLGISRRTVIRTMLRLERVGFVRRIRHGGNFHRNLYEPVWSRFREHETEWKRQRYSHGALLREQRLSPSQRQASHVACATAVTQTCPINQSEETFADTRARDELRARNLPIETKRLGKRQNIKMLESLSSTFHVKRISSRDAAHDAAERRWSNELNAQFSAEPTLYAQILDAIDPQLHEEATLAELATTGAGLRYILDRWEELKLSKERNQ